MDKTLIDELSQLNKNEKLLLVEALWDSIAADPDQFFVPDHHKSILEKRLKTLEQDKEKGSTWKEVRRKYR
jgi:putative addiction module component (TIGR02574 family)